METAAVSKGWHDSLSDMNCSAGSEVRGNSFHIQGHEWDVVGRSPKVANAKSDGSVFYMMRMRLRRECCLFVV